jgi:hypothetical protein
VPTPAPSREGPADHFGWEILDCLFEADDLFVPVACFAALVLVGMVVYELAYRLVIDPDSINVASRLDSPSIAPEKWFPRS